MQVRRTAAAGTRCSNSAEKSTSLHQHGLGNSPGAGGGCIAQPFGPPHKGQRAGSRVAVTFTRPVYRAADAACNQAACARLAAAS
jgi:hypothetical protein